jgi:hypothetical protein
MQDWPSITTCFLYESSMVGSYWGTFSRGLLGDAGCPIYNRQQRLLTVSTKCCRVNCMVSAVFPTPPSPSTTSLYSTILPAMMKDVVRADAVTAEMMGEWKRKREGINSSGKHSQCCRWRAWICGWRFLLVCKSRSSDFRLWSCSIGRFAIS